MFQQFIISPFSYRRYELSKSKVQDPLNPKILEHRLKLFEIVTLPSIKSQDYKDFSWIIIVDPELPENFRNRLKNLTSDIKNTHLHDFSPIIDQNNLSWLKAYIDPQAQYIVTSKLDCDDGLFRGFTRYIKGHLVTLNEKKQIPPLLFFGCKGVAQWDFFHSKNAPLGFKKPWTRKETLTVSAGLTICSKYPELDFSVMGFGHHMVDYLCYDNVNLKHLDSRFIDKIRKVQIEIEEKANNTSLNWKGVLTLKDNFHSISTQSIQTVILNHFGNVRFERLFEASHLRIPVNEESSFPEIDINYTQAFKYIISYRRSWSLFMRVLTRHFRYKQDNLKGVKLIEILRLELISIKKLISGFKNLK